MPHRSLEMDQLRREAVDLLHAAKTESSFGHEGEAISLLRSALAITTLTGDQAQLADINAEIGAAYLREHISRPDETEDYISSGIDALRAALEIQAKTESPPDLITMVNLATAYARRYRHSGACTDLMAVHIELDSAEQACHSSNAPNIQVRIDDLRKQLALECPTPEEEL